MGVNVFADKLKELYFDVKKIKFPCDVRKETDNIYSILEFIEDFNEEKVYASSFNQIKALFDKVQKLEQVFNTLHTDSLKAFEKEELDSFSKYCEIVKEVYDSQVERERKKEERREDAAHYYFFGVGCLMAIAYTLFLFIGSINFIFALPLICTVLSISDKTKFKKLSLIPYSVIILGTLINYLIRILGASPVIIFFNSLDLAFAIAVGLCSYLRVVIELDENRTLKSNVLFCITAIIWSASLFFVYYVAPALIFKSIWHVAWFIPAFLVITNAIVLFIETFIYEHIGFLEWLYLAYSIIGLAYIVIRVLFSGPMGLEFILLVVVIVAEIIACSMLWYKTVN